MHEICTNYSRTRRKYFFENLFDNRCHHINNALTLYCNSPLQTLQPYILGQCRKTDIKHESLCPHLATNSLRCRKQVQEKKILLLNYEI